MTASDIIAAAALWTLVALAAGIAIGRFIYIGQGEGGE